jgi:hypothetical protein
MAGLPWTPGEFIEQAKEAEQPRFTSCEAAGQVAECRVRGLHAGPEAVEAARMWELRRREKRAASSMTRRARCSPRLERRQGVWEWHVLSGRGDERAVEGQENAAVEEMAEAAGVPNPGFIAVYLRKDAPAFGHVPSGLVEREPFEVTSR